jgi:hypothetical protein
MDRKGNEMRLNYIVTTNAKGNDKEPMPEISLDSI